MGTPRNRRERRHRKPCAAHWRQEFRTCNCTQGSGHQRARRRASVASGPRQPAAARGQVRCPHRAQPKSLEGLASRHGPNALPLVLDGPTQAAWRRAEACARPLWPPRRGGEQRGSASLATIEESPPSRRGRRVETIFSALSGRQPRLDAHPAGAEIGAHITGLVDRRVQAFPTPGLYHASKWALEASANRRQRSAGVWHQGHAR